MFYFFINNPRITTEQSILVQDFLTSLRHIVLYGFSHDQSQDDNLPYFSFTGQSDAWYPALELASVLPDSVSVNRRPGPSASASVPASWACALPRNSSQCTERQSTPSRNAGHDTDVYCHSKRNALHLSSPSSKYKLFLLTATHFFQYQFWEFGGTSKHYT